MEFRQRVGIAKRAPYLETREIAAERLTRFSVVIVRGEASRIDEGDFEQHVCFLD